MHADCPFQSFTYARSLAVVPRAILLAVALASGGACACGGARDADEAPSGGTSATGARAGGAAAGSCAGDPPTGGAGAIGRMAGPFAGHSGTGAEAGGQPSGGTG